MDSDSPLLRTPPALDSLWDYIRSCDEGTQTRGRSYQKQGKVRSIWTDGNSLCADVSGTEVYISTLTLENKSWVSSCSCPVASHCKHSVALAFAWLERSFIEKSKQAHQAKVIPQRIPAISLEPQPEVSIQDQIARFVAEHQSALDQLGAPALDLSARQFLERIFSYHQTLHKQGKAPSSIDLRTRDLLTPGCSLSTPWLNPFSDFWDKDQLPASAGEFWQYLAFDFERHGKPFPWPKLLPLAKLEPLRQRVIQAKLNKELSYWKETLRMDSSATNKPRPPWSALRLQLTPNGWVLQERADENSPFHALNDSAMMRLSTRFRDFDFRGLTPDQELFHRLLKASLSFCNYSEFDDDLLLEIFQLKLNESVMVGPDEQALVLEPETLHHLAMPGAEGCVVFQLRKEDGTEMQDLRPLTTRPFPIYHKDSRFWRGPRPLPKQEAPRALLDDPNLMRLLHLGGTRFEPSLHKGVSTVMLIPCYHLSLAQEWQNGNEYVEVELYGAVPDAPQKHRFCPDGWHWDDKQQPARVDKNGTVLLYDGAHVKEASYWLSDLELRARGERHWSRPLTKDFPDAFQIWRGKLPAHTRVFADKHLSSLLEAPWKARIQATTSPAETNDRDWFDLKLSLKISDVELDAEELALLLKAKGGWVRLPRHGFRKLDFDLSSDEALSKLGKLGLGPGALLKGRTEASHRLHALQLSGGLDLVDEAPLREHITRRIQEMDTSAPALPGGLRATLRPYQVEGYHFLGYLSRNGFGGVLADDMGLGKTVQSIAWLLHLRETIVAQGGRLRALIVCPKSVTHGWLNELGRFAPELGVAMLSGQKAELPRDDLEILICNYAQLRLRADSLQKETWSAVLLDEGQFIKNPSSQVAQCARALKSRHRLVLTGTPVENKLLDLWSLFAFAQPGLLGNQSYFKEEYGKDDPLALERLRRRTRHFMLRRTKAQVATDLPERIEDEILVDLEGTQRKLYDAELKKARQQLLAINTAGDFDKSRFSILTSLLRLRQICCHPALVTGETAKDEESAKLEALMERVIELQEEGHKVLIFSQFVGMLDMMEERLLKEKIQTLKLTGQTENRQELVQRFESDPSIGVFLLSIKAAGFGLNLTSANYVFLYDPWWNPAVENQAIDRTHRIGQTQVVTAYRLLAANTIEQKIRALQLEKASLAGQIVQEESLASVLDLDSLRKILG